MKLTFLENFEEKFYFKTSRLFWHILIGLAGLSLVIGILIFLWGITPSFKPSVDKPEYPEPVKILPTEIQQIISPVKPDKVLTSTTGAVTEIPADCVAVAETPELDPAEKAFRAAEDSLRVLLPPDKFPWQTRGHWERSWYRNRWVVDFYGITHRLESAYEEIHANNFDTRKSLLESYLSLVGLFPQEKRLQALLAALEVTKDDLSTSVEHINLLKDAVPHFTAENTEVIRELASFAKKNPRDGRTFLGYVNQIMPQFAAEARQPTLDVMLRFYYRQFKVIERQKEATDLFLPMLSQFKPEEQPRALNEYYSLFIDRNQAREQTIEELDEQYAHELNEAESVLQAKKSRKAGYRSLAWKIIIGSLVFIALVALFLVLLSIQRNIKLLRESMAMSK